MELKLTENLKGSRHCVEQNHMFIRVGSNEFFKTSIEVIPKMLSGEYNAQEAYTAFDGTLRGMTTLEDPLALFLTESYSGFAHSQGGNPAFSFMANTLRGATAPMCCWRRETASRAAPWRGNTPPK